MRKYSGVLLHINSLHGPGSIGTMGKESFRFIDILYEAGQSIWQMLPIHPPDRYDSPYSALSAFAGNPDLITEDDSLNDKYGSLMEWRSANSDWIEDWVLFKAIREVQSGKSWYKWPEPLRKRNFDSLDLFREEHAELIENAVLEQFQFEAQWLTLRSYANSKGIRLFGDMPFFVAWDSADVWANQHLFNLGRNGRPTHVAGVPPDYFSRSGQRWGNPLYNWAEHDQQKYRWWRRRLEVTLRRFDMVRIDHFRAFEQNWAIPERNRTARRGRWEDGPGKSLLEALQEVSGPNRLVAEDLGIITPSIIELRREYGIPGMAVLQFAFDSEDIANPHHPENIMEDIVCYTGTHDNDTTRGWFKETDKGRKPHLRRRRKRIQSLKQNGERVNHTLIRTAMESPARIVIIPMQDLLGLDSETRMNLPGRVEGNWKWRMEAGHLEEVDWDWLRKLTEKTGRAS